jgi:L-seryl-tRNA(Ser) seleniumtransferase
MLPSVEAVLQEAERALAELRSDDVPTHAVMATLVRLRLDAIRDGLAAGTSPGAPPAVADIGREVAELAYRLVSGNLRRVINATGVALQTNLGRSVLSDAARRRVDLVASGYSNLEYDLVPGRRGERAGSLSSSLEALLGRPGVVVNNNAASLVLALATLARRLIPAA